MTVWWSAVAGGAFYTRWSALASLLVAGVFSVPSIGGSDLDGYLRGSIVAVLGWMPLAAALVPVAVAERRLTTPASRGAVVLSALLIVAGARSAVNDVVSRILFDVTPTGPPVARIATNLVTALALLSIVAIITSRHSAARDASDRLRTALALLDGARLRRERAAEAARRATLDAVTTLRGDRDRMLAGAVDFDAVRAFSAEVREASHRLDRMRRAPLPPEDDSRGVDDRGQAPPPAGAPVPALPSRLVPPPWALTGLLYAVACFPFAAATGGPAVGAVGIALAVALDLVASAAVRRWARPPRRAASFLVVWTAAGVLLSAVTFVLLPAIGVLGLVPVLAVPVVAVLVSLCRDALERARTDERAAGAAVTEVAGLAALADSRGDLPLERAVEALHGRAQGACVVLGALADDGPPDPAAIARFRERTDAAFDDVLEPASEGVPTARDALERLIAVWDEVIAVSLRVEPGAEPALQSTAAAEQVVAIVNEALVNAVKHSGARRADVDVDLAPEGGLRLRIASPGVLGPAPRRGLGATAATIRQRGDDVVLEAVLSRTDGPAAGEPGASSPDGTERPAERAERAERVRRGDAAGA